MTARQVHGTTLVDASELLSADEHSRQATGERSEAIAADGIVVRSAGVLAAVATADCVPILLAADRQEGQRDRWAACVHAGWRGTLAGIAAEAVRRARADGVVPLRLHAVLGPSIGSCCYEVGKDVAVRFREADLPVLDEGARSRLDLRDINRRLLESCGLAPQRIRLAGPCTSCRSDRYHSYRRSSATRGRQLSWIGWEAASP